MKKFTFKIHNPTGRYRSFDNAYMDIKLDKKVCGVVHDSGVFQGCKISLQIKNGESFITTTLAYKPATLSDAKKFLNENIHGILKKFDLHYSDN